MTNVVGMDSPISIVYLFSESCDRALKIVPGHVTEEEVIVSYPHFSGWEYVKEKYDSPSDFQDDLSPITVTHSTVGEIFGEDGIYVDLN